MTGCDHANSGSLVTALWPLLYRQQHTSGSESHPLGMTYLPQMSQMVGKLRYSVCVHLVSASVCQWKLLLLWLIVESFAIAPMGFEAPCNSSSNVIISCGGEIRACDWTPVLQSSALKKEKKKLLFLFDGAGLCLAEMEFYWRVSPCVRLPSPHTCEWMADGRTSGLLLFSIPSFVASCLFVLRKSLLIKPDA